MRNATPHFHFCNKASSSQQLTSYNSKLYTLTSITIMKQRLACLYFVLVLFFSGLMSGVDAATKSHHTVLYTTTSFNDQSHIYIDDFGQLASYSNRSVAYITGKLYEPPSGLFDCARTSNLTAQTPAEPFIVFLPLPTDCPYTQARIAEQLGALGIVFYSSQTSQDLNIYHDPLKVVVTLVTLTDQEIRSLRGILNFNNTTVSVTIKKFSNLPTNSHTFYFVVFAFSILVLLSLIWFSITYARRCYDHITSRRKRNLAERRAVQMIKKLPTKKYRALKTSDSDSLSSLDEPTCAVCLDNFQQNESIRELPCKHEFHLECIDPWLKSKGTCPLCKYNIIKGQPTATATVSVVVYDAEDEQNTTAPPNPLPHPNQEDEDNSNRHSIPTGMEVPMLDVV